MTSVESQASDERFLRQLGIYNPAERKGDSVTFIGCGGIGSFAAAGIAKLGVPRIKLIDPDTVEEHNIPNQNFTEFDVGQPKVDALADRIGDQFNEVDAYQAALPDERVTRLDGLIISGLDSMEARREVWESCIKLKPSVTRYIDARLSGQFIVAYSVNPSMMSDVQSYEKTLHSDDEAEDISCTARGIIDVGLQVASLLTRAARLHFSGAEVPNITIMNQESYVTTQGAWVE